MEWVSFIGPVLAGGSYAVGNQKWCFASGANQRLDNDIAVFDGPIKDTLLATASLGTLPYVAVNRTAKKKRRGPCFGERRNISLEQVQYVPGLMCNLLSVSVISGNL